MSEGKGDARGADKRRHDRKAISLMVEYDGADDMVADFTDNLSSGGTFVHTTNDFPVGTEISLVLSFPGLLDPIAIEAVVRWTQADAEAQGVGLEFIAYGEARDRLDELIQRIEDRDPAVVSRLVKILVVEDNPHVSKLIRDGLRGAGHRTFGTGLAFNFRTAANGVAALEILAEERFDALIIDVYMPILDGASVIEQVRANPEISGLPIIAVSAGGERAREFAMNAGADFFLDKPMRLRQIIETMQKLIDLGPPIE